MEEYHPIDSHYTELLASLYALRQALPPLLTRPAQIGEALEEIGRSEDMARSSMCKINLVKIRALIDLMNLEIKSFQESRDRVVAAEREIVE
jgi:hypothetical protein